MRLTNSERGTLNAVFISVAYDRDYDEAVRYVESLLDRHCALEREAAITEFRKCCDCRGTGTELREEYDAASNEMEIRGVKQCNGRICKYVCALLKESQR